MLHSTAQHFNRHYAGPGNFIESIDSAVDNNEDAKASEFTSAQQISTRMPHLIETEGVENRLFSWRVGIRLGRRVGRPNRPAPTNRISEIHAIAGGPKIECG